MTAVTRTPTAARRGECVRAVQWSSAARGEDGRGRARGLGWWRAMQAGTTELGAACAATLGLGNQRSGCAANGREEEI